MSEALNTTDTTSGRHKPAWIRVKAPTSREYTETRQLMRSKSLHTVCEEAACPNIGECWKRKHATVMILGDVCTRACRFCNIKTGRPGGIIDQNEPRNVADAVIQMGLAHVVITSVDRDDLDDGGAQHFADVIHAVRQASPGTTIEVLTPDFRDKGNAADIVIGARPDVFNHNMETVPRLYTAIRPSARYFGSLMLLAKVKEQAPDMFTKSGIMVGLGEQREEILQVMDDLRTAQVDFLTIGQYLQPTPNHVRVERFVEPAEFEDYARIARAKGFLMVSSTPLTRSSYHADRDFAQLRSERNRVLSAKTM